MTEVVRVRCVVCHRLNCINASDPKIYEDPVTRENFICLDCRQRVVQVKVKLTCTKCGRVYQTKILAENVDKYKGWVCPNCIKDKMPVGSRGKRIKPHDCQTCLRYHGICTHPELRCTYTRDGYAPFGNGDLYSINRECTILCIHKVDRDRDDIHCFKYSILHRSKYLLHMSNAVIIKQRKGSKRQFSTNVLVFIYNKKDKRFTVKYDKEFGRGVNWVPTVRNLIVKEKAGRFKCNED